MFVVELCTMCLYFRTSAVMIAMLVYKQNIILWAVLFFRCIFFRFSGVLLFSVFLYGGKSWGNVGKRWEHHSHT